MLKIGITGKNGFIATHIKLFFHKNNRVEVIGADHATFDSIDELDQFVASSDIIIHLAGMNRGNGRQIKETNILLTKKLIDSFKRKNVTPHVIFASSTQVSLDNDYGASKRESANLLKDWSSTFSAKFTNLLIPNVYGEWGKPFYNSVVATFIYQIANKQEAVIHKDNSVEFIYVQDLVSMIYEIINSKRFGDIDIKGKSYLISDILKTIQSFKHKDPLSKYNCEMEMNLSGIYQACLFPDDLPRNIHKSIDEIFESVESTDIYIVEEVILSNKNGSLDNHIDCNKHYKIILMSGELIMRVNRLDSLDNIELILNENGKNYIELPKFHSINYEKLTNKKSHIILVSINTETFH